MVEPQVIDKRILGPDEALPAERQLASDLSVSRITVRKAIDGLVNEGLLVRRPGSGNFINTRIEKNFAKLTSFSEDMRARGRTPRSVWLKRSEGTVTPEEALRLRLSPGAPVYRFHRIRYADEVPMCLEYATIVASCLPALDAVDVSMYDALEQAGNRPVRALQRLSALLLTGEQASLLQAEEGDAGLSVERLGFLRDGRAGLISGPSTLKMVRVFRALRTGMAWRMALWYWGANRKQTFSSSRQRRAMAGLISRRTPNLSSRSEDPVLEETLRLPCLATLMPHSAPTSADRVETLMVCRPSPPVPTISQKS